MEQIKSKTVKTVGFMMVIMLVGKILGLFRDIFLANYYGSGMAATAFTTASIIPRTFFDAMFASAISASFIPVFNQLREQDGEERAFRFAHTFVTVVGVLSLLLTVVGVAAAKPLVTLYADGFDAPTAALCVQLLRILFPTIFFTGVAYSFVGVLQSLDEFGIPAALSIASNGVIILYYLFLDRYFGIYGLAVAFLVGWAMQMFVQLPALRKKGYTMRPRLVRDPGLARVGKLMLPVMVSTWIQPINLMICTKYASRLFSGSGVTNVNYANNLYTIIVGVVVSSIANVIFPQLSRQKANADEAGFGRTLSVTTKAMCFLLLPMMVGLFALSTPLVRFLYERNAFTAVDTYVTARSLRYFTLGMVGYGLQMVLSRAFYAEQNGRLPLISGAVSILVNLGLCITLVGRYDVAGLGLASAVAATVSAVILAAALKRRDKNYMDRHFWLEFFKMLFAALVMGAGVTAVYRGLSGFLGGSFVGKALLVIAPMVVGVLIYVAASLALRIEEARMALAMLKRLGRRGPASFGGEPEASEKDKEAAEMEAAAESPETARTVGDGAVRGKEGKAMESASVTVRVCRGIAGFFSRQFSSSFLLGHFLNPPREQCPDNLPERIFYGILDWLRRGVHAVGLDRLLETSLFAQPFLWVFLTIAFAPLLPTMGVLALALLSFFALFLRLLATPGARLQYSAADPAIYLYAGVYLFATLTSVDRSGSLFGGLLSICFVLFSVVVKNAVTKKKQLDLLVFFMTGIGLLVSLYGFYQYLFPAKFSGVWHDVDMFTSISFRVYSTLGNPNVLGEYLLLVIPIAFAGLLCAKKWLPRLFYLAGTGAMLLCLALTYSRGCYVAILISAVVFLVMLDRRFILLVLLGLVAMPFVLPQTIVDRFRSIGDMADSSTSYRVYIWMGSLAMLKDYWLSGIGPGTAAFNKVYPAYAYNGISAPHSHNLYLQTMVDGGVCAIVVFAAAIFLFFKTTCSALTRDLSRKTRILTISSIASLLGFLVQSLFDYTFYNYRVTLLFWAVFALGLVFARRDSLE